jgi:hypothetical protein
MTMGAIAPTCAEQKEQSKKKRPFQVQKEQSSVMEGVHECIRTRASPQKL